MANNEAISFNSSNLKIGLLIFFLLFLAVGTYFFLSARYYGNVSLPVSFPNSVLRNNKVHVESRVPGYSLNLTNKQDLEELLRSRNLFVDGAVLGELDERTPVDNLRIILTPQKQENLVINWQYPNEIDVGLASGWEIEDRELIVRIYLKNDDSGLKSAKANLLINEQLVHTILHLTRRSTVQEDINEKLSVQVNKLIETQNYLISAEQIL